MGLEIRPARPDDAAAILAIYAHYCLNGHATFEEAPPTIAQMTARMSAVEARGLPWVVAELDGAVRAYAYAGPFRERTAYRFTAEDTVYVDPAFCGRGLGRATLDAVIRACADKGLHRLLAVIGGSDNAGSIALHRAFGFDHIGVMTEAGFKHDRWVDVVMMQLALSSKPQRV